MVHASWIFYFIPLLQLIILFCQRANLDANRQTFKFVSFHLTVYKCTVQ